MPGFPTRALPTRASAGTLTLEGALDADAYIVGPGDGFTVSIGGQVPRQSPVVVSADGRMAIPEAGTVRAAGRTLSQVRAEATAALSRRYANVPTDVVLTSPRRFYVHVSGNVPSPGRQEVPGVARVEDALASAAGQPAAGLARYGTGDARQPALRSVRVTHRTGREETVDLMRYLMTGDLSSNPYLLDGDVVHLPAFDPIVEGVVVGGAVDRPGTYDVRPGDTALDLIVVASGTDSGARIGRIRRVRPGAPPAEVALAEASRLDIQPRDQLFAVPSDESAVWATIEGAVRYPGLYPVSEGSTTLAELIDKAGGLRDDALERGAYLERAVERYNVSSAAAATVEDEAPLTDISVDSDLLTGLLSREFYTRQTNQTPRVSLPEGSLQSSRVTLYEGDRLVVPFDFGLIRVYGRVGLAGYQPFRPGQTAGDYIALAGGVLPTAAEAYVVDAATGRFTAGLGALVRPGDAVFVNSQPSPDTPQFASLALQERQSLREDARDRRQGRVQLIQTVTSVVATVASLIVAYATFQSVSSN